MKGFLSNLSKEDMYMSEDEEQKIKFQNISEDKYHTYEVENIDFSKKAMNELSIELLERLKEFIWSRRSPIEDVIRDLIKKEDITKDTGPLMFTKDNIDINITVDTNNMIVTANNHVVYDPYHQICVVGIWRQILIDRQDENIERDRMFLIDKIVFNI